ncbi:MULTISPECIES: PucR family transcriptional regulator [unclassified Streptomyces]|uniref:PucR family transcriptional regulator n=1 Tax=unclassified Streptomyces TaxID=2593676 RepID=UPI002E2C9F35|nr:helix-turn-helix domain-containing protein [Streptomyces sp. NBC_01439]
MCELLNRIWSRPRGEWTRILRRELPVLADEIVKELLHGTPAFTALVDDYETIDDESLRQLVENALCNFLGYPQSDDRKPSDGRPRPQRASDDGHDGRQEEKPGFTREVKRNTGLVPTQRDRRSATVATVAATNTTTDAATDRYATAAPPDRAREELFKALTDARAASGQSLTELAEAAGWPLPPAVRGVVLATPGEAQQLAAVLDDSLAGVFAGQPCLLVPSVDPDPRAVLELPLRGRFAAVGHAVPPTDTASSLRWALRLLALTPARPGAETRPVFVDDHLSTLLLLQDQPLAHALAAHWLRPLAGLTPRQSERLEETLLAWFEGGGAPEAAKALSVHPQTVRYRMRQLEKLFGPGLRDPRTRFELEMALRTRRLMAQVRLQHSRMGRRTGRAITTNFPPLVAERMARVNGL